MKWKRWFTLVVSLALLAMLACPVLAQSVQPRYVGEGYAYGLISTGSNQFQVIAGCTSTARRIEVSGTLYEKGLLWDTNVASCSNSTSGSHCTATGSYTFKSGKSYRLDYSATFYYADGTSETISGST